MQSGSGSRELLAVALEKVRGQINAVKGVKRPISEQDTKGSMIEPILASLGWDTSNLDEVRREYRHNSKDLPVDYAFFSQGKPIMFLEAKSIGHGIDDHKWMAQIVNYSNSAGVEICVLTNGDEYRVFNTHARVPLQEKLIAKASIVEDEPDRSYAILECLSRIALLEQRIIQRWQREQLEHSIQGALQSLVSSRDKRLVSILATDLKGKVTPQQIREALNGANLHLELASTSVIRTHSKPRPSTKGAAMAKKEPVSKRKSPVRFDVSLQDLMDGGILTAPAQLQSVFRKQVLTAQLNKDSSVSYQGTTYQSLSEAGGYARNSVNGPPADNRPYYPTNGWTFWSVKDKATGKLATLAELRDKYQQGQTRATAKSKLKVVTK